MTLPRTSLVGIEGRFLRQVAHAHAVGGPGLAGVFGIEPGHDLHQGRLAGAVDADDADLGAGIEGQPDVLQNLLAAGIGLGQTLHDIDELRAGHRRVPCGWCLRCGAFSGGWGLRQPLADFQQTHLRRHAEADGEDGGADAGRDEEVSVAFADQPGGVAPAVFRRHHEAADERQVDLAAMGVAGDGEEAGLGKPREDVGGNG